ncbi:MAG: hypothetical protein ACK5B9_01215 [Flavobacteriia bacterium]
MQINGVELTSKKIDKTNKLHVFDCSNYTSGLYLVQWYSKGKLMETKKWMKL